MTETYTLPEGEHFVAMTLHQGRLFVASTAGLWVLENDELRPLPIVAGDEA